ncbi:MAG: alpha-xenorhabdolysin family binary toxin subunit A [Burkholderiaceae bacterium]|nr:alpha-xenorhabdolysin family binary toxin subunit A [Burkholderiaceae bacterium]
MHAITAHPDASITLDTHDLPKITLQLLTGYQQGASRPSGIFTKEDLINIKTYVRNGLALPTQRAAVETAIGYKKIGIHGLEPADIQTIYSAINTHAQTWDGVEHHVVQQGIDLTAAAKQVLGTGDEIISTIKEMPILERTRTKLGDLTDQQLKEITYSSEDKEIAVALGDILATMKQDIDAHREKTVKVKSQVSDFRIALVGGKLSNGQETIGLEPQVKAKNNLMRQNNLSKTTALLEAQIKEKNDRIEQLKKDYDKYVGLSFSGAAGGIIGLAITGGIFGAKAEAARKEKNALLDEVQKLESQVTGKKALQTAIEALSRSFNDLGTRMLDAEIALNHLDYMWQSMMTLVDSSASEFAHINDAQRLTSFTANFKKIVEPWRDVQSSAEQLVHIFDEAIEQYKKTYQ